MVFIKHYTVLLRLIEYLLKAFLTRDLRESLVFVLFENESLDL